MGKSGRIKWQEGKGMLGEKAAQGPRRTGFWSLDEEQLQPSPGKKRGDNNKPEE